MYLNLLKILFAISGILFVILFSIRAFGKFKDLGKLSPFVSSIAIFLLLYVFFEFILAIFVSGLINKLVIILFALSPFLIGKIVTYKKLKFYSIIQILCVILSIGFVALI